MSNYLQLREQLDRLKHKKLTLTLAADAAVKAAKETLAIASITPLHEIDLKTAASHLQNAIIAQDELAEVMADMRKIERELGL